MKKIYIAQLYLTETEFNPYINLGRIAIYRKYEYCKH